MGKVFEILSGQDSCVELDKLREEVNRFSHCELSFYKQKVKLYCERHSITPDKIKNFYDAVWGTITVNEGEKLILDSPIMQRLRNIKQLGLADLLYSCANHSRFSHTLGVLHTASSIWHQIHRELKKYRVTIDDDVEAIIRIAAIFHDCGHMFCSHASERFFQSDEEYSRYGEIEKIRNFFKLKLDIKPGLSEIISVLIVCSPDVRDLLTIVHHGLEGIKLANRDDMDNLVEKVCCLILGFPFSIDTIPYSQIISGPIDSDKLDYLKRDSHTTGVPVAVDMSRIFQKLRVVDTDKKYKMLSNPADENSKSYLLGIAPAAINSIDHLVISRYMMYESIYFHQKVLTAEETLRFALQKINKSTTGLFDDFSVILQIIDAWVLNRNFNAIIDAIPNTKVVINDTNEFNNGVRILRDLSARVLLKRCITFTDENIFSVGPTDHNFYGSIFVDQDVEEKKIFVDKIVSAVDEIKDILKDEFTFNRETDIIVVVTPSITSISLNSNIVIADKGNRDRNMIFEADNWLKSRSTRKPQNYLAAHEEDRYITFIAVEKVLFKEYGLLIQDNIIYDKEDERQISKLKQKLDGKGYFANAYSLLPNDEINRFQGELEHLIDSWRGYERFDITSNKSKDIDLRVLISYIKQFYRFREELGDFDVFIRGCIELLKKVKIVTKNDIINTLVNNIKKVKEESQNDYNAIQICNLGTSQDSGSQIAYHVNEVNELLKSEASNKYGIVYKVKPVNELTEDDIKPVMLFIEDAFSSGKQIASIFEELMGIDIENRKTSETHGQELPEKVKEKLKASKLYFSFIFYNKDNEERLRTRLAEIGLSNVHFVQANEFPRGYFKTENVKDQVAFDLTKKYFEKAGHILLMDKALDSNEKFRPSWNSERVENSVLGYNDAQQLIVYPWNTPTYTITALWLSSKKENWYSLFQRIDK